MLELNMSSREFCGQERKGEKNNVLMFELASKNKIPLLQQITEAPLKYSVDTTRPPPSQVS